MIQLLIQRWKVVLEGDKMVRQESNPNMYKLKNDDTDEAFEVLHIARMGYERLVVYRSLDVNKYRNILALPIMEFKMLFEQMYKN